MSALHDLIETEYNLERLLELLKAGENPNTRDQEGHAPLHIVTFRDQRTIEDYLQIASVLIRFKANVNLADNLGYTPLHFAVIRRNYEMVKILLEAKAQINTKSRNGFAALHYAILSCSMGGTVYPSDLRIVKLLLEYNAWTDSRIPNRKTPLILAVQNRNLRIVQELLRGAASPDLGDSEGNTAFHYALNQQVVNVFMVRELLKHGCSYSCPNRFRRTPMALYVRKLLDAPIFEAEKAKCVFKLILFDGRYWSPSVIKRLKGTDVERSGKLSRFVKFCRREIAEMQLDLLSPFCTVFDVALRGYYHGLLGNDSHVPIHIYNKILKKLIKGQYPAYCDLIVSGLCCPYINYRFAQICSSVGKTNGNFFNVDILYRVSLYLSQFDMLNMMIACSGSRTLDLKRYQKHSGYTESRTLDSYCYQTHSGCSGSRTLDSNRYQTHSGCSVS